MRTRWVLLVGIVVVALGPGVVSAQMGGGRGSGMGPGMGMGAGQGSMMQMQGMMGGGAMGTDASGPGAQQQMTRMMQRMAEMQKHMAEMMGAAPAPAPPKK